MQPTTKTALIVAGCIFCIFAIPATLIILRDFIPIIIFTLSVVCCLYLVCYHGYQDLLLYIKHDQIQEERIFSFFNGNPEKIRFYKAFKKHFDGELNLEQLRQWLIDHPRKK
jgi:hypothetical protein